MAVVDGNIVRLCLLNLCFRIHRLDRALCSSSLFISQGISAMERSSSGGGFCRIGNPSAREGVSSLFTTRDADRNIGR